MDTVTRTVEISGDAATMSVHIAEPKQAGRYPAVIVFMEAYGVNQHIKSLAGKLAAEGYVAAAPDMYYRQGRNIAVSYADLSRVQPIMRNMYDAQINADVRSVIDLLKQQANVRADRIGCIGYSMGGTISWLTACLNRDIKAAAVYYPGGLVTRETNAHRPVSPHAYAEILTAPVLGCFGETDQSPPPEDVQEIDNLLTHLGKTHDFKTYPGAGHGFFNDERPGYNKAAAADAWKRTIAWFSRYLKT